MWPTSDFRVGLVGAVDQLARGGDLVPGVPQQHAAHAARAQIVDDALAVRLHPVLHDVHVGAELADGFVAEVEEIGVEVRQVLVGFAGAGHVAPGLFAHHVGVVLVLHSPAHAERAALEVGDIAGGVDVGLRRAQLRVDDDAVVGLQAERAGESQLRLDADAGDDGVGAEALAALCLHRVLAARGSDRC